MANEKLIVAMAERLGLTADVLSKSDDEVQSVIDELSVKQVFMPDEIERLKSNAFEEAVTKLSDPKNQLPQAIYKRVQGTVLETTEGRLKKKFGYNGDHQGIEDLVEKMLNENKTASDTEITQKYENLKKTVKELEAEKEQAVTQAEERVKKYIINDSLVKAMSQLPIKASDDALPEVREVYLNNFLAKYSIDIKNNKIVVSDKDTGKPMLDRVNDPLDLVEVLKLAKPRFLEFKDATGGRGDSTTSTSSTVTGDPKNTAEFVTWLSEKFPDVKPNSARASELLREVLKRNPNFNKH